MFENFPTNADEPKQWAWSDWEPHYRHLLETDVTQETIDAWLHDWSTVSKMVSEVYSRLHVAKDVDTNDESAEQAYRRFMSEIYPEVQKVNFQLEKKLVESGIEPDNLRVPLRDIRTSVEIFREENVPLFTQKSDLDTRYNKILGAQTVEWEGEEITLRQLEKTLQDTDRDKRERAFRLADERRTQDREALDELWREYMALRKQIYQNAVVSLNRVGGYRNSHKYLPN